MRWLPIVALAAPAALPAQQPGAPHIAVIEADAAILSGGNPFPFNGKAVVFTPRGRGYALDVEALGTASAPPPGTRAAAYASEPVEIDLPFAFPFFGRSYRIVYAYLHGAVLLERPRELDPRVYPAVLTRQPPMIAALFHPGDRHPSGAGLPDGIYVDTPGRDRVVITWYRIMPAQVEQILNTFQVTLSAGGGIRIAYQDVQFPEGIVGLSNGDSVQYPANVRLADPNRELPAATFYEWFKRPEYDPRQVAQAFYRSYPDSFDALAVFENFPVSHAAVAAQTPVKNDVRGIGLDLFDHTAEYGSAGRLRSVLALNTVDWIDRQSQTGMLGHEFAHRWLAYISFMKDGRPSFDLLDGHPGSHWCFYLDTRTGMTWEGGPTHSFMFGSKWDPVGDGRFLTGGSTGWGYSPLDLYVMGLLPADSVPDFFYVDERPDQGGSCVTGANPATGRRHAVSVRDVIAANGPRDPGVARSQKRFRTAFVLLVRPGTRPTAEQVANLDRLRANWSQDFTVYTGGRATMDTRLAWDSTTGTPGSAPTGFRLSTDAQGFALEWAADGRPRRFGIPRAWLVPPRAAAHERDAYVSSFAYDTGVTAFSIRNGLVGLHLSSYAIAEGGSAGAAAGRDVFLILDPRFGKARPGLPDLGITKERLRAVGCPAAKMSHFLTGDVDGDGLTDIGKIDERVYCVETFEGGRPAIAGPLYDQDPVTWFVFRAGRWQADLTYRGRMPGRFEELPLVGIVLTPVDFVAYAAWRTYDSAKWGESTSAAPRFVPAYRRRLAADQGRRP